MKEKERRKGGREKEREKREKEDQQDRLKGEHETRGVDREYRLGVFEKKAFALIDPKIDARSNFIIVVIT